MDRDLSLLMISRALRSFVAGYVSVVIGLYLLDKGFSLPEIGVVFAVGSFSNPLLSLAFGLAGDRAGTKRALLVSLFTLVIGLTLTYLSANFYLLLLASALSGYGTVGGLVGGGIGASAAPLFSSLISRKVERERLNWVMTVFTALSSYSGAAGALLSGLDYSTLLLIGIFLALASTLVVVPVKEPEGRGATREDGLRGTGRGTTSGVNERKYLALFSVTGALNGVSQGLVVPFMPVVLKLHFGMNNGLIGSLYTAIGVASATVMLLLSPKLSESMGIGRFIFVSRTVSAVSALGIPFVDSEVLAIVLFVFFMTLRVLPLPAQQALMAAVISERRRGTAFGLNQSSRLLPFSLASLLGGYLFGLGLLALPFVLALIATEGGASLYYKYFADLRLSRVSFQVD